MSKTHRKAFTKSTKRNSKNSGVSQDVEDYAYAFTRMFASRRTAQKLFPPASVFPLENTAKVNLMPHDITREKIGYEKKSVKDRIKYLMEFYSNQIYGCSEEDFRGLSDDEIVEELMAEYSFDYIEIGEPEISEIETSRRYKGGEPYSFVEQIIPFEGDHLIVEAIANPLNKYQVIGSVRYPESRGVSVHAVAMIDPEFAGDDTCLDVVHKIFQVNYENLKTACERTNLQIEKANRKLQQRFVKSLSEMTE